MPPPLVPALAWPPIKTTYSEPTILWRMRSPSGEIVEATALPVRQGCGLVLKKNKKFTRRPLTGLRRSSLIRSIVKYVVAATGYSCRRTPRLFVPGKLRHSMAIYLPFWVTVTVIEPEIAHSV